MKVFSGIRPSGELTIGNYFGAIKQWLDLQKDYDCVFSIADFHAITTDFEPEKIKKYREEYPLWYLAAGLKPDKSIIFYGSSNPDHTNLAWIFSSMVSESELQRMTQYKDKKEKEEIVSAGLLNYPILQAADILLYDTELVPVGEDQVQHIEFTRKIARKFNNKFGQVFVEPEAKVVKESARIMSLTNPNSKMSKSGPEKSKINLADKPEQARKKITSAVTDSEKVIKYDPESKPEISNLLNIFSILSNEDVNRIEERYKNESYAKLKQDLADQMVEFLTELQAKKQEIDAKNMAEDVLLRGLKQAQEKSNQKMKKVFHAVGLN